MPILHGLELIFVVDIRMAFYCGAEKSLVDLGSWWHDIFTYFGWPSKPFIMLLKRCWDALLMQKMHLISRPKGLHIQHPFPAFSTSLNGINKQTSENQSIPFFSSCWSERRNASALLPAKDYFLMDFPFRTKTLHNIFDIEWMFS